MDTVDVLIVDDDDDILNYLSTYLKSAGLKVDTATNGAEALNKLKQYLPELIISDVQMPEMNGYELCRQVRASGLTDVPFFFYSALGTLPERIKGLRMGADDYIVKPVDPEELLLKIKIQLEKRATLRALKERSSINTAQSILKGDLSKIAPFEVFQVLDLQSQNDIWIHFDLADAKTGNIYISEKLIVHADVGEVTGLKAFYRLLGEKEGKFIIKQQPYQGEPSIIEGITELLMEGLTYLDEYNLLISRIKDQGDFLYVKYSKEVFTFHFDDKQMEILRLVAERHVINAILDASSLTDLDTIKTIFELMQLGFVEVEQRKPVKEEAQGSAPAELIEPIASIEQIISLEVQEE